MRQCTVRIGRGLLNTALVVVSLVIVLAISELTSRVLMPISPGAKHYNANDPDGLEIGIQSTNRYRHQANIVVRQVSTEFDVRLTFTAQGHRVPDAGGNPDTIFLGDSFTFGQGLEDDETFPYIYCIESGISCANLAKSGSGTGGQIDILEHYLKTEGWRPQQVKLFMLIMTGALVAGNDLFDNLVYEAKPAAALATTPAARTARLRYAPQASWTTWLSRAKREVLSRLNLARIVYFFAAPMMRTLFSPKPPENNLAESLAATQRQLERLKQLSHEYGFFYSIYIVHPMQDIIRGTHENSLQAIQKLAPEILVKGTAQLFLLNPVEYYYSFDGHFNPRGSRKIAEYLLAERRP